MAKSRFPKKVRVIVEVRSKKDFTQKRLVWAVERALEDKGLQVSLSLRGADSKSLRVKRYSNVQGYETRVLDRKVRER